MRSCGGENGGAAPLKEARRASEHAGGSVAEWSKALDLGSSHFDGVGSNPTAAKKFWPRRGGGSFSRLGDAWGGRAAPAVWGQKAAGTATAPRAAPGLPRVGNGEALPAPASRPAVPRSLRSSGLLTPPASAFASFPQRYRWEGAEKALPWDKTGSRRGRWQQSPPQPCCGEGTLQLRGSSRSTLFIFAATGICSVQLLSITHYLQNCSCA